MTKTNPTEQDIETAQALGAAAFFRSARRVPALDPALHRLIPSGAQVGYSLPLLKAWTKGWDAANLSAEVK